MFHSNAKWEKSNFSRRAFILIIIKCLVFFIILTRLFFLQVLRSHEYRALSDRNRIKFLLIEPKRGLVLDRNNTVLAENQINYHLYFYKQRNYDYSQILKHLFDLLEFTKEQKKNILASIKEANYIHPISIEENLSWVQVARVKVHLHKMPGVYIEKGYRRFYPLSQICAHVIGYVGSPTKEYIKQHKLYYNKGFKIGKTGIEKVFDENFIGQFGSKKVEINAHRVVVRELSYTKSTAGQNVSISIDSKLQQFIYNRINQAKAAAIVTEVDTGDILSMVSTPAFDPNMFTSSISQNMWNKILEDKSYPLTNKALNKLYPPGSIWKIIIALAILKAGISPNKTVYCSGAVEIGNRTYRCWKHSGHGYVDLNHAIACSCNSYFYEIAPLVGIDNIHYIAHILGFGNKVGIELPGEASGINPNKAWKQKVYRSDWVVGDTVNASIGQGYNSVTLLQLATMMSRVASGKSVVPTLLPQQHKSISQKPLDISVPDLILIREALSNVFNRPYGVAYNLRINEEDMKIAGKTGTAQIISQDSININNRNLRSHSIFAGFGPVHLPKYSVAVVVDNAGWGAKAAAPLGKEILYFIQQNYDK